MLSAVLLPSHWRHTRTHMASKTWAWRGVHVYVFITLAQGGTLAIPLALQLLLSLLLQELQCCPLLLSHDTSLFSQAAHLLLFHLFVHYLLLLQEATSTAAEAPSVWP